MFEGGFFAFARLVPLLNAERSEALREGGVVVGMVAGWLRLLGSFRWLLLGNNGESPCCRSGVGGSRLARARAARAGVGRSFLGARAVIWCKSVAYQGGFPRRNRRV